MRVRQRTASMALTVLVLFALLPAAFVAAGPVKTFFKVSNLSCSSCLFAIRTELAGYDGMVDMEANLNQGWVAVTHEPILSPDRIADIISSLGYPARVEQGGEAHREAKSEGLPPGAACYGCENNGCSATAATWKQLWGKFFGAKAQ